jgi:glycosyltransferase involved in cell wall biosynthesis
MPASASPTYSIVTTCKGRLDDLKQSLPRFAAQRDAEVIVVDYDCPQHTADFVRSAYPSVTVVAVADRPLFSLPDARNCGVAEARGDVLVFLDADIIVAPDLLDRVGFPSTAKAFATFGGGKSNSLCGSCIVRRQDFDAVGGYDDLLSGYEGEDLDLYMRLDLLGARRVVLEGDGVERVIEQSQEERLRYRPPTDIRRQFLRGQLYQLSKESVMRARGVPSLDRTMRTKIMAGVDSQLDAVYTGAKPFDLTINIPDRYKRGLLSDWEFSTAVSVRARKKVAP